MKQTLFTKQLAEYFNIYLPINKKCSKNTISSYADGFVALFRFFKEIKGIPHSALQNQLFGYHHKDHG